MTVDFDDYVAALQSCIVGWTTGLHISNAEFDASVGDLKATLDKLQVPNPEQKELLAIIESTRPQVAEER